MSITTPASGQTGASRRIAPVTIEEDSMAGDVEMLLQPGQTARSRWLDLCFRLIILALAALWLLVPPAGGAPMATDGKAIATTR
jgi:hypothetical protein